MTTMKTNSPYYKWASELIAHVRIHNSMTSLRLAEKIEAELGDFLDEVGWCDECEWYQNCDDCTGRRYRQ